MGGSLDTRIYFTEDKEAIETEWNADVDQSRSMDGTSYSGCIGMLEGFIDFVCIKPLNSQAEANEYVSEHHRKWDGPMAVPFKIKGAKAVPAYVKKAENKVLKAKDKIAEVEQQVKTSLFNAKSQFVACKVCKSKLNRSRLSNTFCPLCNKTLLSDTSTNRIEKAKTKAKEALQGWIDARDKAVKDNATGKVGYLVGGICSS